MDWIREGAGGVELNLRIVPRASRDGVQGVLGDQLKIRLSAPPVDGRANEALIRFLANRLEVPRGAVTIVTGTTGRAKRVAVAGVGADEAKARLLPNPTG